MKKFLFFVALIVLSAFGFWGAFMFHQAKVDAFKTRVTQLEIENKTVSQKLLQMSTINLALAKQSHYIESRNLINDFQLKRLVKKGLKDPVNDLRNDLVKHPELIPYKGVVGGTVGFGGEADSIVLLNEKWILAVFSDGHFEGEMLLEFKVLNNKIEWKVIDSYIS